MPIHGYPGGVITANPTAPTSSVASGVWTTEQQLIAKAAGNWPFTIPTQQISRSLRFNSADSAYLSRTFGSNGNQKAWTLSFWVKRSKLGDFFDLFGVNAASPDQKNFRFNSDDTLTFYVQTSAATVVYLQTSQVFRDVSAWYHVVLVIDTANATSTDRIRLYANGSRITAFSSTTYPSLNLNIPSYNTAITHYLGSFGPGTSLFDGYMTEINFIDGQALTPSSFGQTNASTGVWEPIAYTGTYGTNGFYLNFSDNSNTTAATLGKDYSGNGNNWTPNNFSVTAGAGNDSLVDSPTSYGTDTGVGGEVRGNYCTANPLKKPSTSTITNGNLDVAHTSAGGEQPATFAFSSGKWYWEVSPNSGFAAYGIILTSVTPSASSINNGYHYYGGNGQFYTGTSGVAYGATFTNGDVIGVALNLDTNQITFYKNGVSQGAQSISAGEYFPDIGAASTTTTNCNFGQRAFAYTAPSGFKALCTQNLPTPTIGATSTTQANDYFNVVLYTGNGTSQTITGVGFQPDFVWAKGRSFADFHVLEDAIRGATKSLSSDTTTAEVTRSTALTAFTSDGFSVGSDTLLNYNANTFVAWNWKANGAGGSNTAGSITSTVSASTTSGFSIVTYTGTGSNATVGHGLGVAPSMIFVKYRNVLTSNDWNVYHSSVGATGRLFLNLTSGTQTTALAWNNTAPTSTVFSIGTGSDVNNSATNYVAYCFAPVAGYSAFGSYTGNGSTDGPFVYLGFRPRFVMFKNISSTSSWLIIDTQRSPYNQAVAGLLPNSTNAETGAGTGAYDFLSNGFKPRNVATNETNVNGNIYIYAAFAEFPFKFSLAR